MPTVSIWQCEAAGLWLDILWMIPLIMDIVREECSELKCIAFPPNTLILPNIVARKSLSLLELPGSQHQLVIKCVLILEYKQTQCSEIKSAKEIQRKFNIHIAGGKINYSLTSCLT